MNILVYGAGVIGSIYAARLRDAGHEVSILARGERLTDIREIGIVLEKATSVEQTRTYVNVVEELTAEDAYDLILVAVRKHHVAGLLPVLARNRPTPIVLFMVNNACGYEDWTRSVGRERLMVGFPGAAGAMHGKHVRYTMLPRLLQPTTLGEPEGRATPRLKAVVAAFRSAGFPTVICRKMDAWQKSHIAWVSPLGNVVHMTGGDMEHMALCPETLGLLVRAIREGFRVLHALDVPVTPWRLRLMEWAPSSLLTGLIGFWVTTRQFENTVVRHSLVAHDEMKQLALEFEVLARRSSTETPALDTLHRCL